MCHIENQIAEYCNQEETYCPLCGGEMTFDKDYDLECDDIECGHVIIMTTEDFE